MPRKTHGKRLASIILGIIVIASTVSVGLMILVSTHSLPDGVYIVYPYQTRYFGTKPWTPPKDQFGLIFIDAENYPDSVKFKKDVWTAFLMLLKSHKIGNLTIARVTCSRFPDGCEEESAKVTLQFYEYLVYKATHGYAYPPSLLLIYYDGEKVYFVDLIVPKYPGPTDPYGIYYEVKEAIHRYSSQLPH